MIKKIQKRQSGGSAHADGDVIGSAQDGVGSAQEVGDGVARVKVDGF